MTAAYIIILFLVSAFLMYKKSHRHSWEKWKITEEGTLSRDSITVGRYIYQSRECNTCGHTQIKYQKC